ncbi:MAG TPA: hypothetical protein PKM43_00525 [Verrucomicrobiota bacterium]|nr:hypothetical protein [Verrucomicrobiota bacterium]HRZ35077.1 hypothetical protein [Candidatus Paceibacterota bacterium]
MEVEGDGGSSHVSLASWHSKDAGTISFGILVSLAEPEAHLNAEAR